MDLSFSFIYNRITINKERTGLGIKHPIYHHDFEKNGVSHETGRLGDYTVYTNSLGFKDKSNRKISKDSDGRRIVCIGDSFTEGILLNYEDTFVGMIDSALSKRNIEVLNAGRVSYSPIIYWKKIKYLIEDVNLKFDELVVFIDISDIDDEASYYELNEDGNVVYQSKYRTIDKKQEIDYGLSWISNKRIHNIKVLLKKNFIATSFIMNGAHDFIFKDSLELQDESEMKQDDNLEDTEPERDYGTWEYILSDYRSNWTFDNKFYDDFGERGKERMIKYMDNLKQLCDENEITMSIVVYPWPSQIWYEDLESRHVKIWQKWSNDNNVKFINLFPSFIKLGATNSDKLEIMNRNFVPYDLHYNQNGNRIIAEGFINNYFK